VYVIWFCLWPALIAVLFVQHGRNLRLWRVAGGHKALCYVQCAKFLCVDFPVQLALVHFLLSWYDKSGMRCQLCLLDPDNACSSDSMWHFLNVFMMGFILTSAIITSMLLVKFHQESLVGPKSEEQRAFTRCLQIESVCMATLPFTTGLVYANKDQIGGFLGTLVNLAVGIPCVCGWAGVAGLCLVPLVVLDDVFLPEDGTGGEREVLYNVPQPPGKGEL